MLVWQQFLVIVGAHFLALLSPGPDFFLIVRSAMANGVKAASGVCAGIALANGVYIALAISGVSLLQEAAGLFAVLKWGGCIYLAWLGWNFLGVRRSVQMATDTDAGGSPGKSVALGGWWKECRVGFLSGILNPKNSLFYASLFSLGFGSETSTAVQLGYGVWMFLAVLLWDLCIARAAGHPRVVRRFMTQVKKIERVTGAVLLSIAAGIAWSR